MNVVKSHLVRVIAGTVLLFSLSMPLHAQDLKIGVVNIPLLMEQAPQARLAMAALEEEFQPRQRVIVAKQTDFKEMNDRSSGMLT